MATSIRAALVQYEVGAADSFESFARRVVERIEAAARDGANLVVFPEYLCADLLRAVVIDRRIGPSEALRAFEELDDYYSRFVEAVAAAAGRCGLWIVAGTFAHRAADGAFRNAAQVFGPQGERFEQPKLHVAYELVENRSLIRPGDGLFVFDMLGARTAVFVCYDAQFPETGRAALETGEIDLIIVPGCAMEEWGIWRLRTATAARAMETFAYGLNVQLAGSLDVPGVFSYRFWARSSAHSPVSRPFAPSGILADSLGAGDELLLVDLDIDRLREARPAGYPALDDRKTKVVARSYRGVPSDANTR